LPRGDSHLELRRRVCRSNGPRAVLLLAWALALAAASCQRPPAPAASTDDHARYHDRTFRVARVVDGDTVDIAVPDGAKPTTRVRLWGVDAPEIRHGGSPEEYFGAQSAEFAERTLAGRDVHVLLVQHPTRGRFGRLLAYVHLDRGGPMFNELLIEQGCAYADPRFDHPHLDRFAELERAARQARRGLWAAVTVEQMPKWRQRTERRPDAPDAP
jgi:endonuclease YncB( thermonuclease family)